MRMGKKVTQDMPCTDDGYPAEGVFGLSDGSDPISDAYTVGYVNGYRANSESVKRLTSLVLADHVPCTGDCYKDFLAWQETQGGNITQTNYEAWKAGYMLAERKREEEQ